MVKCARPSAVGGVCGDESQTIQRLTPRMTAPVQLSMSAPAFAPADQTSPTATQRAAFAQPLAAAAIARGLTAEAGLVEIETARETGSTNSDLLMRARQNALATPVLRAALLQTAGRGRHGRRWFAAAGSALLFSLAVPLARETLSRRGDGAVTLACGVAVAEALRALDVPAQLKWPNDLWLAERKLGGLLCELALDTSGARTLVVGCGINLWLDAAARASIGQPAAAVVECVSFERLVAQREAWIGTLASAILAAVREYDRDGFLPFQPRFMRRFVWLGRDVEIVDQGVRGAAGRALGVDAEGRLLLQTATGTITVAVGDVSLRAAVAAAR